jgi:hypothetical protein
VFPSVCDGVELSVRSAPLLYLSRRDHPISGQSGEGGINLTELQRFASAEVGVVVAFEVVAVTRFTLKKTK